jgi:hypothetical protein
MTASPPPEKSKKDVLQCRSESNIKIPIANIGLAATIIQEATIMLSEKKDLASRIFLLFNVDKYLYVTRKLTELMMEALIAKKTAIKPTSVLPIKVYRGRDENGVIIAQPGIRSLEFLSIDQMIPSSLTCFLNQVF